MAAGSSDSRCSRCRGRMMADTVERFCLMCGHVDYGEAFVPVTLNHEDDSSSLPDENGNQEWLDGRGMSNEAAVAG